MNVMFPGAINSENDYEEGFQYTSLAKKYISVYLNRKSLDFALSKLKRSTARSL